MAINIVGFPNLKLAAVILRLLPPRPDPIIVVVVVVVVIIVGVVSVVGLIITYNFVCSIIVVRSLPSL